MPKESATQASRREKKEHTTYICTIIKLYRLHILCDSQKCQQKYKFSFKKI